MTSWLPYLHGKLLNFLRPFLKWASDKHLPYTHKLVNGRDVYAVIDKLKPGHIFLTKVRGDLTSFIIPGYWSHAAIFAPTNGPICDMVMEAEGPGVIQTDLITFMTTKDYLLILEPNLPEKIMERAADLAEEQLGKPYDYDFQFHINDQKAFYCSELVWWAYAVAAGGDCPLSPQIELGVATVSPDRIAASGFKVIYDSRIK